MKKGYYHLSSDGWKEGCLFYDPSQYAYGMTVIGLLVLRYHITIYAFELMPNHIHILLSGDGEQCLRAFDYFVKKISARLVKDGFPPLPEDYGFKLVLIEDRQQMRNNFVYIARNAYEKQFCVPGGYPWGSAYLHFSLLSLCGRRADTLSKRELERITGSRITIPSHWQFHSEYGLLPSSFVESRLFSKLFLGPKDYEIHLVKDYEAFAKVARSLEELFVYSSEEALDLIHQRIRDLFGNKKRHQLSGDEMGRLAVLLYKDYDMPVEQIVDTLHLPEHMVQQFLRSKDYGRYTKMRQNA